MEEKQTLNDKVVKDSAYWGEYYDDETDSLKVIFYNRDNKEVAKIVLGEDEYEKTYDSSEEVDGTCIREETEIKLANKLDPLSKGQVKIRKIIALDNDDQAQIYVRLCGKDDVASFHYPRREPLTKEGIISYLTTCSPSLNTRFDRSCKYQSIDTGSLSGATLGIRKNYTCK